MSHEENDLLEALRNNLLNLSNAIDKQNETIAKYEKALKLAANDCSGMSYIFNGCKECCFCMECGEQKTSGVCKKFFLYRWKSKTGLI